MRPFLYINICLLIACASIIAFFGWSFGKEAHTPLVLTSSTKEYNAIRKPWFTPQFNLSDYPHSPLLLQETQYRLLLPDLRNELHFYGKNMRPDAPSHQSLYFIGLGEDEITSITDHEPLYLKYNASSYAFSPDNEPTSLWIEMERLNGEKAEISVHLVDEYQEEVEGKEELRHLTLPITTIKGPHDWQLGKHRVDATLLVRQKARFVGEDLFLQMHGGEEYTEIEGAQRIDFLDCSPPYSCFVRPGEYLIWDQEKWSSPKELLSTHGKPLLSILSIDDRMMQCELWDSIGSKKVAIHLLRLKDHYGTPDIAADFQFVQAKTWAQFIVECRGKKMTLRPNDWLILTDEGWEKIDSVEKLENYVSQNITGPLLVIEKLQKEEGGQVLSAHLFNSTRSQCSAVKLEQKKGTR